MELAVREKKPRVVQGKALNLEGQLPENFANVLTRSTVVQRIVWNDRVYPLREVKDAKTGRILSASIENNTLTILFGDKMQPETIVRLSTPVFSDPAVAKAPERMRELAENLSNLDLIIIGLDHKVWKVKLNVKEPIGLQVDPPILNHQSPK
ncbi:MAG: hypothetical protein RMJ82_11540 [Gemmatales bacterium]|nr:hypothetical protein [Gemmatales bacterium]